MGLDVQGGVLVVLAVLGGIAALLVVLAALEPLSDLTWSVAQEPARVPDEG